MRAAYALIIDTGREDLPPDPAVGFSSGIYRLSTDARQLPEPHFQCLDGSSLGTVSQENMILFGGEFSLMGNASFEILSPELISHFSLNGINPMRAKCSLSAFVGEAEIKIFRDMQVASYSQESPVSFRLAVSDSAFAAAFVPRAAIPVRHGGGDLPVRVGGNEFIEAREVQEIRDVCDQGSSRRPFEWGRTFSARSVRSNDGGKIAAEFDCGGVFAGDTLEVVDGKGKGNVYEVLSSDFDSESGVWRAILDAPYEDGVLQGTGTLVPVGEDSGQPHLQHLTALPALFMLYSKESEAAQNVDFCVSVFLNPKDKSDKITLGERSVFRAIEQSRLYAAAFGDKTVPPGTSVREDFGEVKIIALPDTDRQTLGCQCRYALTKQGGTSIHDPRGALESQAIHVKDGDPVSREFQRVISMKTRRIGGEGSTDFRVGAQISVQWDLGREFSGEWLIPAFGLRAESQFFSIGARALLLADDGVALASREFFAEKPPSRDYGGFSGNIYGMVSMNGSNAEGGWLDKENAKYKSQREVMAQQLRAALKFDAVPPGARSVYLQVAFLPRDENFDIDFPVCFRDEGILAGEAEAGRRIPLPFSKGANPIDATADLCSFCGINFNRDSFASASGEMSLETGASRQTCHSYYELEKDCSLPEKIAEACRAANFSVVSDGSRLEARFLASASGETLRFANRHVAKGSFDIEYARQPSCVTDWDFTLRMDGGRKFLSINPRNEKFPEASLWEKNRDCLPLRCLLTDVDRPRPEYDYRGGACARVEIPETAAESGRIAMRGILPNSVYALSCQGNEHICMVRGIRRQGEESMLVLFEQISPGKGANLWEISLAGQDAEASLYLADSDYAWKNIVMNDMDASWLMARSLWCSARKALELTGASRAPDERHQNLKFAAFDSESRWLGCLLWKVMHCEYPKSIVSFSVPLEAIEPSPLWQMLLRRAELEFGLFRNSPLKGWIAGVELSTERDEVKIRFVSSEPLKDRKYYDENELPAAKTIVETNVVQNTIKED